MGHNLYDCLYVCFQGLQTVLQKGLHVEEQVHHFLQELIPTGNEDKPD